MALYIPLVLFVIALVACFLALDYIRRGEVAQTKEPAHVSMAVLVCRNPTSGADASAPRAAPTGSDVRAKLRRIAKLRIASRPSSLRRLPHR